MREDTCVGIPRAYKGVGVARVPETGVSQQGWVRLGLDSQGTQIYL